MLQRSMLTSRSWSRAALFVVNQLTSDTNLKILYPRTGKILLLYQSTGRSATPNSPLSALTYFIGLFHGWI